MANPGGRGPTLLVASTGGHLEQLWRLSRGFEPPSDGVVWVTHEDFQSRSLLADEDVRWVPYVPPRGYRQLVTTIPRARAILREQAYARVASTGAGLAVPFLLAARQMGIPAHYIESAARADGPSLSGRILQRVPGIHRYSQYEHWADHRWTYQGSLFDTFAVQEGEVPPIRRVVVTLGTMRTYGFRRLVDRLIALLPEVTEPDADILWQVGVTDPTGIPGRVSASVPGDELRAAIADADLVIAHSGIGSALTALEAGRRPVLVPRRSALGEHVDDHQELIAGELSQRDLAITAEADRLTADDLRRAAAGRVAAGSEGFRFPLVSGRVNDG